MDNGDLSESQKQTKYSFTGIAFAFTSLVFYLLISCGPCSRSADKSHDSISGDNGSTNGATTTSPDTAYGPILTDTTATAGPDRGGTKSNPGPGGDPYENMHRLFLDAPEAGIIRERVNDVMSRYGKRITPTSLRDFTRLLMELRNESGDVVSEMDILRHMFEKGKPRNTLEEQARSSVSALMEERIIQDTL